MKQVRCVKAFGLHEPGDMAEVPDDAAVDPVHYEVTGGGSSRVQQEASGSAGEDPAPGAEAGSGAAPSSAATAPVTESAEEM